MINRPRVLVANPDPGIRRLLRRHFDNAGYSVVTADLGRAVLDQLRRSPPDVIILSTEMTDLGGVDLITRLHALTTTPLLVLNPTQGNVAASVILDAGADDCLDEPFMINELAARIRRLLRRTGAWFGPQALRIGLRRLEINMLQRSASLNGEPLGLSRREFDLLTVLAAADGRIMSHEAILQRIWGADVDRERQNLRRLVGSLRRKIEPEPNQPRYLVSIHGSGYRLNVRVESDAGH